MSETLNNLALLQRIIRELKTNNADTYFWNKISDSTWNEVIKNKLFTKECSEIYGQHMKTLQGYDDYTINYLQHEENEDSAQDRDQRNKFQPIFDCIAKALNLPSDVWKNGITEKELVRLIKNFKSAFIPPKQLNNPKGRTAERGGSEALLLSWIIEEIIKEGFLGQTTWASIISKITNKYYDPTERKAIGSWAAKVNKVGKGKGISSDYYYILQDIADELEFDMKYWGDVSSLPLGKHINIFKEKHLSKLKLDLGTFDKYVKKSRLNKEEKEVLSILKETSSLRDILAFFDTPSNNKIFQKSPSDRFLKDSIEILYDRGAYALINDRVIPEISDEFFIAPEMKLFRAHIYGSEQVKRYMKAIKTLDSIKESEMEKFADNKTAFISNILRHELDDIDENTNIEDLKPIFEKATDLYSDIFLKHPHYYPGINYAYMLDIGLNLFPNSELFEADTIEALLLDSQDSIDIEKSSNNTFDRYYATISEAEFKALLGTFDQASLHKDLVAINPSQDTLIRTLRQIRFYLNTFSNNNIQPKQSMQDLKNFLIEFLDTED